MPVLPRHIQARVLGAIALVMVLVIAFSGRGPVHETKPKTVPPPSSVIDPSPARIQDYRAAIDDATKKLAAEEAELAQTKQALPQELTASRPAGDGARSGPAPTRYAAPIGPDREGSDVGSLQAERVKREYASLFASNIALTFRSPVPTGTAALRDAVAATLITPTPAASTNASWVPSPERDGRTKSLPSEDGYRLSEGTIIETVLTNRLDSSFSGPVNCMVTTNVYSRDGSVLLIPQGTRLLGEARKVEGLGDQRLAVFFHRLIRPDDYAIDLNRFQGLDQIGATGLRDQVNHHYLEIFGASLAVGSIAGLAQANTRYGTNESAADGYEQGAASSVSQSALHILDRFLNVVPTFTIREGQRVKVYLSQDLTVPAYEPSKGPLP